MNGAETLILYRDGLTIYSSSGQQNVTTSLGTFPINSHASETVTASARTGEPLTTPLGLDNTRSPGSWRAEL